MASLANAVPGASGEGAHEGAPALRPWASPWLIRLIRAVIFVTVFATPLLALPFTADPLFAKVVLVEVAAVVAGALWLLDVLLTKRITYRRMPTNAVFLGLAVLLLASTVSSAAPWASFWGSDPTGERAASVLAFITLAFVAAAVFRREDVERAVGLLLGSFLLLAAGHLASLLAPRLGVILPTWLTINPAGTENTLGIVVATGFLLAVGMALTAVTSRRRRLLPPGVVVLATAAAAITGFLLLTMGFRMLWVGIAAAILPFLAAAFTKVWVRPAGADGGQAEQALGGRRAAIAFAILMVSLFAIVKPLPFVGRLAPAPLEVSPSLRATYMIAGQVLRSDPLLGLGPANFRLAFNQFRDASLNASIFWQARFTHGFSFFSTILATLGIAGLVAFLAVAVVGLGMVGRSLWRSESSDPYRWGLGLAALFVMAEWFLYASNFTATFTLVLALGLFAAAAAEARPAGDGSWWRITRRTILVASPAVNFTVSLVVVFAAAFSLVALWALGASYAAEVSFKDGMEALIRYGNTDTARVRIARAIALNPKAEGYYQGQAQVVLSAVGRIITQAVSQPSEELSQQFRAEFSAGVRAATAAVALAPSDPDPWMLLGSLYEAVTPFIPGADRAAGDAYDQAGRLDPQNPAPLFAKGRASLTAADAASLQASQSQGEGRTRLDDIYRASIAQARAALESSIRLKSDLAAPHFLLAQVSLREGNAHEAIRKTEEAASLAPGDVGVAFQLGVLYYRTGDFESAARTFRRAIALNDNYSNARYFLGLIYDGRGDRDGARSQFEKISALNPDNGEVERIVANLRAGRRALDGIAPPPETRREPPIPDTMRRR